MRIREHCRREQRREESREERREEESNGERSEESGNEEIEKTARDEKIGEAARGEDSRGERGKEVCVTVCVPGLVCRIFQTSAHRIGFLLLLPPSFVLFSGGTGTSGFNRTMEHALTPPLMQPFSITEITVPCLALCSCLPA